MEKESAAQVEILSRKFSRLVNTTLRFIEASLPESNQLVQLKRLVQNSIYDTRNDLGRELFNYEFPERKKLVNKE